MALVAQFVFIQIWILTLCTIVNAGGCWRNTTCSGPEDTAFPGEWEKNIYAPSTRTVRPKSILHASDTRSKFQTGSGHNVLKGNGSQIIFDFGLEVGGIVTVDYTTSAAGSLNLAFTEAKDWVGPFSDSSNGAFKFGDGYLSYDITAPGKGTYTMPDAKLRGGFRYLTIFLTTDDTATLKIDDITLEIGFQPTWSNLRAYQGYFHSNDELLNRIWYSGAYTVQTNAVPVNTGRQIPTVKYGWDNNATLGPGDTIIVDGAKRDRAVWPGDMGIAVPSTFVSIGDLESVKNALQVMYNTQNSDGSFAESGPPLSQQSSDTYHMWSMIGTYNYVLFTNDTAFLEHNWEGYQKAMNYIYDKVNYPSGLLNVTGLRDWARWQQGYNNSEAQMILYHTLQTGAKLAQWADDTTGLSSTWTSRADNLGTAINTYCFDDAYGAFKDNATATTLHPQDANSMSILFGVADADRVASISEKLTKNWTPIGAVAPELPENISPFISSFEIQAHFVAGRADRALDLIRREWGWYINNPNGTESTVIEGYLQNATFGYRSSRGYYYDTSYVSHAHGWSSGPTSALTNYVLGLSVTGPLGSTWQLAPQFGDLESVQGGFMTALGKYQAAWSRASDGSYEVSFEVPQSSEGVLILPAPGGSGKRSATLNGKTLKWGGDKTKTISISRGGSYQIEVRSE
ncbi:putative alpha-L-rhamnosidase B [Talaromyces proteolyticus]|uniref:Alpha-L-rhamnosidase B n=1 Tax=Talaromyces proteolyticus TaxID=1131652 RepID=A0AAD4KJK7_9EURO|nr:putative alpha-L-rhamnosidase B [Talaromyces proteolyticus]KAH8692756.1 putative alpha-L-rhamnosidase B [Talaromyces proteolyticus]